MVDLSILLSIHEDGKAESDEHFDLFLYEPWGGARLGSQHRTRVTIIDADITGAVTHLSESTVHYVSSGDSGDVYDDGSGEEKTAAAAAVAWGNSVVAGTVENATIVARNALGGLRGFGGDLFEVWVEVAGAVEGERVYGDAAFLNQKDASLGLVFGTPSSAAAAAAMTRVEDLGSGNHTLSYQVSVVQAKPYAPRRTYFSRRVVSRTRYCMHILIHPFSNADLDLRCRRLLSSRGTLPAGRPHRELLERHLLPEPGVPESRQASL